MNDVIIVNREMTAEEVNHVNSGFDDLYREEGVAIESTERISFVAQNGASFAGCSSGLAHKNGETLSGWFYLTDLFVDKELRNQGLGADLLLALESKLKSDGVRYIWLWTSGDEALRFYATHGYTQFAEMESWYSDGSSRIGLRKTIA